MPTTEADTIEDRRPSMQLMLRNLPAQHREIIVATYFHHRTTSEAADRLGLAPATAKARLYEAMRNLSLMVALPPDLKP
jgi:RNA polymerase sigma-70 factor (ECF subfamily)